MPSLLAHLLSRLFQQMGVAGPGSVRAIADVHANQCIWPLEANARKPLFALRRFHTLVSVKPSASLVRKSQAPRHNAVLAMTHGSHRQSAIRYGAITTRVDQRPKGSRLLPTDPNRAVSYVRTIDTAKESCRDTET
jgi:hypothetical protein